MDIGPTKEYRRACLEILGADDPETVIGMLRSGNDELIAKVRSRHAEIVTAAKHGGKPQCDGPKRCLVRVAEGRWRMAEGENLPPLPWVLPSKEGTRGNRPSA